MENNECLEGISSSWSQRGGEQIHPSRLEAFDRVLRLQMLKVENSYLEQHLEKMVLHNRELQSMRSKIVSFEF